MSPSSKHRHGASPSSPPYRRRRDEEGSFGGEISEEEGDTFTIPPKNVTIEQHKKWRAEGTPLHQLQNKQEGKKKEEYVTRQEEEYVKIQVEPDTPQMQGVAAQSSFNHSEPMADSESEIMRFSVLIILLVPAVIFGLDFFVQNVLR